MWNSVRALDRVLRGEATSLPQLRTGTIDVPLGGLSLVALVMGVLYGACMGVYAVITRFRSDTAYMGWEQLAASAVKVPALFFLTLLITLPSLYVFNALVGSRLRFMSVLRLLIASMGVMLALLASFGTIVVFFAVSTTSYAFMVLLNVALFAVAGGLGLGFLLQTLHRLSVAQQSVAELPPVPEFTPAARGEVEEVGISAMPGEEAAPAVRIASPGALDSIRPHDHSRNVALVFRIWVIVFALVGAQMGWVLRPFIGKPTEAFSFFRPRESNFFQGVSEKVGELFR